MKLSQKIRASESSVSVVLVVVVRITIREIHVPRVVTVVRVLRGGKQHTTLTKAFIFQLSTLPYYERSVNQVGIFKTFYQDDFTARIKALTIHSLSYRIQPFL